jgi:predicted Zn-ribbon and HTH transcriptional regulator
MVENYKCIKCGFAWHRSMLRENGKCPRCTGKLKALREPVKTVTPNWPSVARILKRIGRNK